MKNEDKSFGAQLGLIALILTMGVASTMNADNTRMHLDIFLWTNNATELDPTVLEGIQKQEKIIKDELMFGMSFIGGGAIWLGAIAWKYNRKSNNSEK